MNWRVLAGVVAVLVCGVSVARAQDAAACGTATKPAMMAADADPDWDVVTVKPSDPEEQQTGFQHQGRQLVIKRKTVENMLMFSYGLQKTQIANAPDWARSELWDAKGYPDIAGGPSDSQYRAMIRKLVRERFGLAMHMEQREMSVYLLTAAKDGAKMMPSGGDPNGTQSGNEGENGGQVTMQMKNILMSGLSLELKYFLDRPVIDKTGLTGRYDFQLRWTSDESKAPTDGSAPPSIFTAVQEQLGLRLEPAKAMADVVVVDAVARPGAN